MTDRASTRPGASALNSSDHICGDFFPSPDKDTSLSEGSEIAKLKKLPHPPKHKHLKSKKDCSKATTMTSIHHWSGSVCKSQDVLQFENVYQAKLVGLGYKAVCRDRRSLPRHPCHCRDRGSLPRQPSPACHSPTKLCFLLSHRGAARTPLATKAKKAFLTWRETRNKTSF